MIYLVTNNPNLDSRYTKISVDESLKMLEEQEELQYDSETTGRDSHLCDLLCVQFGYGHGKVQIVVDCTTVDIRQYKQILESKLLIGHNLKFDLQFLYNYEIVPLKVWDTMVIEQLLHLGYNNKFFHYSLKDVAFRYLKIDIDKSIRGEIIWRGLDDEVIKYAAGDVTYLENIKDEEYQACVFNKCTNGAKLENGFVPVIAYLEWCGIKLDIDKWKIRMQKNKEMLDSCAQQLTDFVLRHNDPRFAEPTLFGPMCFINWNSSEQVIPFLKALGFNTTVVDKKTHKSKDSAEFKNLKKQKGINDEFLEIYGKYCETFKDLSTYGQQYIDSINPKTGRIHTTFWQLGADTGRMSCGSTKPNYDVAKAKGLVPTKCTYPQLQNLPADEFTRASFVAEEGNLMVSCDFAALESRLGADIYNEHSMIKEFLEGSGDIHSLTAKACFPKELEGIEVKDIKRTRPDLRNKAKPVEFSQQFGGSAEAIRNQLGCSKAEAKEIAEAYNKGFPGIAKFKAKGADFVSKNGYILLCKYTGHKTYWEDFNKWREIENENPEVLANAYSKEAIKEHNSAASKWFRKSLNSPTQGTGIIILKYAMILFFRWLVSEGLFGKVLLCDLVHDEAVVEFPKELEELVPNKLKFYMEKSASKFCKKLPIPAVPEVGTHWIH